MKPRLFLVDLPVHFICLSLLAAAVKGQSQRRSSISSDTLQKASATAEHASASVPGTDAVDDVERALGASSPSSADARNGTVTAASVHSEKPDDILQVPSVTMGAKMVGSSTQRFSTSDISFALDKVVVDPDPMFNDFLTTETSDDTATTSLTPTGSHASSPSQALGPAPGTRSITSTSITAHDAITATTSGSSANPTAEPETRTLHAEAPESSLGTPSTRSHQEPSSTSFLETGLQSPTVVPHSDPTPLVGVEEPRKENSATALGHPTTSAPTVAGPLLPVSSVSSPDGARVGSPVTSISPSTILPKPPITFPAPSGAFPLIPSEGGDDYDEGGDHNREDDDDSEEGDLSHDSTPATMTIPIPVRSGESIGTDSMATATSAVTTMISSARRTRDTTNDSTTIVASATRAAATSSHIAIDQREQSTNTAPPGTTVDAVQSVSHSVPATLRCRNMFSCGAHSAESTANSGKISVATAIPVIVAGIPFIPTASGIFVAADAPSLGMGSTIFLGSGIAAKPTPVVLTTNDQGSNIFVVGTPGSQTTIDVPKSATTTTTSSESGVGGLITSALGGPATVPTDAVSPSKSNAGSMSIRKMALIGVLPALWFILL